MMKLSVESYAFVNSSRSMCPTLQRPIFKMSVWTKERFIVHEGVSWRRLRVPCSFKRATNPSERAQNSGISFVSREGRRGGPNVGRNLDS